MGHTYNFSLQVRAKTCRERKAKLRHSKGFEDGEGFGPAASAIVFSLAQHHAHRKAAAPDRLAELLVHLVGDDVRLHGCQILRPLSRMSAKRSGEKGLP
jgi:hypothetical protein